MKKKSAITKLIIVGVLMLAALFVTFVQFPAGVNDFTGFMYSIDLGLDLKGGVYTVYETKVEDDVDARMDRTVPQFAELLARKGFFDAKLTREGMKRLRVEIPEYSNSSSVLNIVSSSASINFLLETDKGVFNKIIVSSEDVVTAVAVQPIANTYGVAIYFTDEGLTKIANTMKDNRDKMVQIDIVESGETKSVQMRAGEPLHDGFIIPKYGDADFTQSDVQTVADKLAVGAFGASLSVAEPITAFAPRGENILYASLVGGAVALALIIAFMCIRYRLLGLVMSLNIILFMTLMFMFLSIVPWVQLALPAIGGVLLSMCLMIGGCIAICERINGEFRDGKSILASYHAGIKKSMAVIIDSNVVLFITALMTLIFGGGIIQGLGLTLLIGTLLSLASCLVFVRFTLKWVFFINNSNRNIYGLKRKEGFDESKEEQYVEKNRDNETQSDVVRLVDGVMPEVAANE